MNLTSRIATMLVSFGAFAAAVVAPGTRHVPMQRVSGTSYTSAGFAQSLQSALTALRLS
jgi:hypothetical protein